VEGAEVRKLWEQLSRTDDGQDIVEYTLLLAFVVIFSAALLLLGGSSTQSIWSVTNTNLNHGIQCASN
jgi:Flp pilus assembly pilin Flp